MKFDENGITISRRGLLWLLTSAAVVGVILSVFALIDAFEKVGTSTTEGRVIWVGVGVAVTGAGAVNAHVIWQARQIRRAQRERNASAVQG